MLNTRALRRLAAAGLVFGMMGLLPKEAAGRFVDFDGTPLPVVANASQVAANSASQKTEPQWSLVGPLDNLQCWVDLRSAEYPMNARCGFKTEPSSSSSPSWQLGGIDGSNSASDKRAGRLAPPLLDPLAANRPFDLCTLADLKFCNSLSSSYFGERFDKQAAGRVPAGAKAQ